ncbi:hypothetical protein ACFO3O_10250 [Dokdonia ponticola]|uniref:Lipid/polyisoprenoid-binding YceI-like domain-containing protein n=1 Tax=Dokdonia ponticola TaxID=2041041 RepID=A0ABV9HX26_9FLAO
MYKKLLAIIFISGFLNSCDVVDELTKFDLTYDTNIIIESSTVLDLPINIISPEVETNSEQEFDNNNTRVDLVESIKLRRLKMEIITPDEGDFNFLNEIRIFIRADGFEEILIASAITIPENNSKTLELDIENIELLDYVRQENYTLRTETITDEVISENHQINIETVFRVDAKILGI